MSHLLLRGAGSKGGAPPVLWTPLDLGSPLKFWFRGDDLSGSDGDPISTWEDQSGNGFDATAAGGEEPQLETAELNSMNVVRAVRANSDKMTIALSGGVPSSAATVYMAIKIISNAAVNGAPLEIGGQFLTASHYCYSDGQIYDGFCTGTRKTVGDPGDLTQWHLAGFMSTTNDWQYWFNGSQFFSTGTNTFSNGNNTLFLSFNQNWDGYMAEIFMTDTVLSSTDREKSEGYLAHKWDLTSVLDGGHPYKSSPPTV